MTDPTPGTGSRQGPAPSPGPEERASAGAVVEQPRVANEQPPAADLRVALAGATLPVERRTIRAPPPEGVHIDDGKGTVALVRHRDAHRPADVVHEVVRAEEVFPTGLPPLPVEPAEGEHPAGRVMAAGVRRPGPHHVRMEERHQGLGILPVPG